MSSGCIRRKCLGAKSLSSGPSCQGIYSTVARQGQYRGIRKQSRANKPLHESDRRTEFSRASKTGLGDIARLTPLSGLRKGSGGPFSFGCAVEYMSHGFNSHIQILEDPLHIVLDHWNYAIPPRACERSPFLPGSWQAGR